MNFSTSLDRIGYLNETLQGVNNELQFSFDLELNKLREEEKLLAKALNIQAKKSVIEKIKSEIEMENSKRKIQNSLLYDKNLRRSLSASSNLRSSQTFNTTNPTELNQNLNEYLSELEESMSSFKKNHSALHKLVDDCPICSSSKYNFLVGDSRDELASLKNTDYVSYSDYNKGELIKPNMIYPKNKSENVRTIVLEVPSFQSNISGGLKLNGSLMRISPLKSYDFEKEYARKIRESYFNERFGTTKKIANNLNASSMSMDVKDFLTLPQSKTLIHDKAWSYGKVETPHYPFRDLNVSKHRK